VTKELPVFDRERQDNLYRVLPFVLGRTLAALPIDILFPFLFSTVAYWLSGLRPDLYHYVMFGIITGLHLYPFMAKNSSRACFSLTNFFKCFLFILFFARQTINFIDMQKV
jgi:hypothetical protein